MEGQVNKKDRLDKTVFKSRLEALEKVTEAEKNKRIINEDTYYEEF